MLAILVKIVIVIIIVATATRELVELGVHRPKDLSRRERVYHADLREFPPWRSLDMHPNDLRVQRTTVLERAP